MKGFEGMLFAAILLSFLAGAPFLAFFARSGDLRLRLACSCPIPGAATSPSFLIL